MRRLHLLLILVLFPVFLNAQEYSNKLKPLLIDLSGWNAEKPEGMDASFNNVTMISATREYTRGDATLQASVLVGQAASSYEIPKATYETDEGFFRSEKINNYMVYISYEKQNNTGGVFVILANSPQSAVFVLTYENTDWQTALDLAKKFDWNTMKNIADEVK